MVPRKLVRYCLLTGLSLLLAGSSGCITQNIIVAVNPDGSGNIAMTRIFPAQAVTMIDMQMREMREHMSHMDHRVPSPGDNPYFNEEKLRQGARWFGPGVTLQSAREIDRAGARGYAALYGFENINDVKIDPNVMMAITSIMMGVEDEDMLEEAMEHLGGTGGSIQFVFNREDEAAALRILIPSGMANAQPKDWEAEAAWVDEDEEDEDEDNDIYSPHMGMALAQMSYMPFGMMGADSMEDSLRMWFRGVRMSVAVEVRGDVAESTASHPSERKPGRFTLFDIDFDEIRGSPAAKAIMNEDFWDDMEEPEDFMSIFYTLPVAIVETNREVSITFTERTRP